MDLDRRAGRLLDCLQRRYGGSPVLLRLPGRRVMLVLSAPDLRRVLQESPEPYSPDNREKHAALTLFQPRGVLMSCGPLRDGRRVVNEAVLDTDRPIHRFADAITGVARASGTDDARPHGGRPAGGWTGRRSPTDSSASHGGRSSARRHETTSG
jgi:hypothetical protein